MSRAKKQSRLLTRADVGPNDPLRLGVAAALAFPDGTMTAAGLRREKFRGRLAVERVAGKDYVTLAAIDEMRKLCRLEAKARASGCGLSEKMPPESFDAPCGLSATAATMNPRAALHTTLAELNGPSQDTLQPSMPKQRRENATVIPLRSQ